MTQFTLRAPPLDRRTLMRGLAGGVVWGATVTTALLALSFYRCGMICPGQIVGTTALAVLLGICAIGPLALFRRPTQAPAQ